VLNLLEVLVRPVVALEQQRFQQLMQQHHYLGALPKISETIWYVATFADQWVALLSFSAAALKCSPRDRWIGWDFRHQYARLKLVTNNSRFVILPDWHFANLVRNRNPGPEGQVRVQLALPSEQPICYTQDLSCPNNLNQGVTNESIS
jgi:hypothetical protein